MKLLFYKQAATPTRIDKSNYLQPTGEISNVIIKEDTNLMAPTFILKTNPIVYNSNYLFNDFTSRFYFIESIEALTGGRIAIHCKIDVLMTYRNEIKASEAWIDCSSNCDDLFHQDYPFNSDFNYKECKFPSSPFDMAGDATAIKCLLCIMK